MVDSFNQFNFYNSTQLQYTTGKYDLDEKLVSATKRVKSKSISQPRNLSEAWSEILTKADNKKTNISEQFFKELIKMAKEIKTDPIDFTFIMFRESRFNSKAKNGGFVGLIQMDQTAFTDCTLRMFEYEQYCKNHPKEKITLKDYIKISTKKDFVKPNIGSKRITFSAYKNLPREKQLQYTTAYLKYRIHEKELNGKKISSDKIWALIHRPRYYNDYNELSNRRNLLKNVKNDIKAKYPKTYNQIIQSATYRAKD